MNILTKIKRWFGDIVYRIKLERAYRKKLKEILDNANSFLVSKNLMPDYFELRDSELNIISKNNYEYYHFDPTFIGYFDFLRSSSNSFQIIFLCVWLIIFLLIYDDLSFSIFL